MTAVATVSPCQHQHHSVSFPRRTTRLLRATGNPPVLRSNFWTRQVGAGGGFTQRSNRPPSPGFPGNAAHLRDCAQVDTFVFMPISTSNVSQNALDLVRQSITNGWRLAFPLVRGCPFHSSLMRLPANASSAQGQCGKLTALPLRASANTNTMTTRSFSSSQAFREAHTGQAFAPSRPLPPPLLPLKSRVIKNTVHQLST